LKQLADFHEIQQGGHTIEDDLAAIPFTSVALTFPKWRTVKLLRWLQNLQLSTWDNENLHADRSLNDEQLLLIVFL
jgi:hypothetical protein